MSEFTHSALWFRRLSRQTLIGIPNVVRWTCDFVHMLKVQTWLQVWRARERTYAFLHFHFIHLNSTHYRVVWLRVSIALHSHGHVWMSSGPATCLIRLKRFLFFFSLLFIYLFSLFTIEYNLTRITCYSRLNGIDVYLYRLKCYRIHNTCTINIKSAPRQYSVCINSFMTLCAPVKMS